MAGDHVDENTVRAGWLRYDFYGPVGSSFAAEAATWVPDHVVVVIEENLSYKNLRRALTYLTELAQHGAVFTNSHGSITRRSRIIWLCFRAPRKAPDRKCCATTTAPIQWSTGRTRVGSNDPIKDTPLKTPNLAAALLQKGRSFIGYSEDLPSPGVYRHHVHRRSWQRRRLPAKTQSLGQLAGHHWCDDWPQPAPALNQSAVQCLSAR